MTKNLKLYSLFAVVWSVVFYLILNWGVGDANRRWPVMWSVGLVYGCGFAAVGKYLGRREKGPIRHNVRATYVATSMLISGSIDALWVILFQPNQWVELLIFVLIASGFTGYTFVKYRDSIKGMKGEELFK